MRPLLAILPRATLDYYIGGTNRAAQQLSHYIQMLRVSTLYVQVNSLCITGQEGGVCVGWGGG